MMKWFFVITFFFIYFIQNTHASEPYKGTEDTKHQLIYNNKYISYEFGISNLTNIYIVERDTICDVYIFDEKGINASLTCPKTPILKWAFDIVSNNLSCNLPIEDNYYKTYYYKLSVIDGDRQITLTSSSSLCDQNDVCEALIEELKTYIIHLWYTNIINDNSPVRKK